MKTTVNFVATISFGIDENWDDNTPISQIKKDTERIARNRWLIFFSRTMHTMLAQSSSTLKFMGNLKHDHPRQLAQPRAARVPMIPERDGAHTIEVRGLEGTDLVYYWHQNDGGWTEYNHQE